MRILLVTAALAATIPFAPVLAQSSTTVTTTVTNPERSAARSSTSRASSDVNADVFVADPPAAGSTVPGTGSDGVIHQWGSQAPVVQAAPPAVASYPPCTNGRTDSCYNPDPRKEADTKAAWKPDA